MNSSNTRLEKVLGKAPECTGRIPVLPLSGWDLCLGVSGREIVPLCGAGCACMLFWKGLSTARQNPACHMRASGGEG